MVKRMAAGIFAMAGAVVSFVACGPKHGTCEYKYDEASRDGSIPKDSAVCLPEWVATDCSSPALSAMTLGLKTSGYQFTEGAKCEERGYKTCGSGPAIVYYKECTKK